MSTSSLWWHSMLKYCCLPMYCCMFILSSSFMWLDPYDNTNNSNVFPLLTNQKLFLLTSLVSPSPPSAASLLLFALARLSVMQTGFAMLEVGWAKNIAWLCVCVFFTLTLLALQSRFVDSLGQTTLNLTVVSPKRDWISKRVKPFFLPVDIQQQPVSVPILQSQKRCGSAWTCFDIRMPLFVRYEYDRCCWLEIGTDADGLYVHIHVHMN